MNFLTLYTKFPRIYLVLYFVYKLFFELDRVIRIIKWVKPAMTVVDVGANVGFYTLLLSLLVGQRGQVHAFEPESRNYFWLQKITSWRKNVYANPYAVSAKSGQINLYLSPDSSVDNKTYVTDKDLKFQKIKCVSLDKYFSPSQQVRFIKIDVQGFEQSVLMGMKQIVSRSNPLAVQIEIWPFGLHKAKTSVTRVFKTITGLGLKINGTYNFKSLDYVTPDQKFFDIWAQK